LIDASDPDCDAALRGHLRRRHRRRRDGLVDCADIDCASAPGCVEVCDNALDDDLTATLIASTPIVLHVRRPRSVRNLFDDDADGLST
jgi:hypothetical protein